MTACAVGGGVEPEPFAFGIGDMLLQAASYSRRLAFYDTVLLSAVLLSAALLLFHLPAPNWRTHYHGTS